MNPDPTALHLLTEQLTRERDELSAQLARSQQLRERLEQQATQLAAYRDEMQARQAGGGARGIEMLRVQHQFNDRLDQALAYQRAQIEATERQAAAAREALLALEIRIAAVDKLLERRATQAERKAAVREQKRSDEWAQAQLWQRRDAQGGGSTGGLGFAF
jgi:flagellar FliJ protein